MNSLTLIDVALPSTVARPSGDGRFAAPTLQLIPDAVAHNVRRMREEGPVMAVVKADGYGHGAAAVASAAIDAGAEWLGTTDIRDAVRLREAGFAVPILVWLNPSGIDAALAAAHRIDVAVGSVDELAQLIADAETPVRVHLHLDTGMARGGCPVQDWPALLRLARHGRDEGLLRIVGVMGHLPQADLAEPQVNIPWVLRLSHARDAAFRAGLAPLITHVGATASALTDPATRFDLVRIGAGLVGIDPSGTVDLAAAGRFTAPVVHHAEVGAGTPVGYGGTYVPDRPTNVVVVGVGYADGIPRELSADASVEIGRRRHRIVGRVSMDQIVIDTENISYPRGTVATIFGPGEVAPSVQEWAAWAGTIPHTIVTGIGTRVARTVA